MPQSKQAMGKTTHTAPFYALRCQRAPDFYGNECGAGACSPSMPQQDVPAGFPLVRVNSRESCLTEASQGPSGSAYNGPCSHTSLTWLHTMFQVPTLLPFPSTGALPAFQLHVLSSTHRAQHKRRLLQEALLDNPP